MLAQETQLEGKTQNLCPICDSETVEQGKNNLSRCPVHSWIDCKTVIKLKELNLKKEVAWKK